MYRLYFDDEEREEDSPRVPAASSPLSHRMQKKNIQKQYAAAKAGRPASGSAAREARKAAGLKDRTAAFAARHKKGFAVIIALGLIAAILANGLASCSVLAEGGAGIAALSTYPSEDDAMLGAEAAYCGREAGLQEYLDSYEDTYNYDEYHYDLDGIEHDPYVLISYLTAWFGGPWTLEDAEPVLDMLYARQYTLTETVETEVRYRTETQTVTREVTDPDTGAVTTEECEDETEVPYDYTVCYVTLENFNLAHLPVYTMSESQMSLYSMYMSTLGNRPDLFPDSAYVSKYIDGNYTYYGVPPEALEDEVFAAMLTEAEKYLGYPYVWGGSSPSTSFDCSGFVSWVINNCGVGWDYGRLGATALYYICTPVSAADAKPGDLVFFTGTYDTDGMSHCGIYVGDDWMIHCGDPIQYANLNSSYWQAHLYGFGRLPAP